LTSGATGIEMKGSLRSSQELDLFYPRREGHRGKSAENFTRIDQKESADETEREAGDWGGGLPLRGMGRGFVTGKIEGEV